LSKGGRHKQKSYSVDAGDCEDDKTNDSEEEEEEDSKQKIGAIEKERQSYQKGDMVLVRPTEDGKNDKYWIGELQENVDTESDRVKVWWWLSFHRNKHADNVDAGNWQPAYYNKPKPGLDSVVVSRSRKRKNTNEARMPYVDRIWVDSIDIRVTFTSSFHLTAPCLKKIHARVNDWKIAAHLHQQLREDKEANTADPNPGFDKSMRGFLQPPPIFIQVDPNTNIPTTSDDSLFCIACRPKNEATNRCHQCKLALCIEHFKSHLFFACHQKNQKRPGKF
jgi:hypothetical protein